MSAAEVSDPLIGDVERQRHAEEEEEAEASNSAITVEDGASISQATFSLVNIYMGLGLLSMPYAMRMAGWLGLLALAVATAVFCLSAKLLIHAFQSLPSGTPHSYANLGTKTLGSCGKFVVAGFTVLEFFGSSCIMLVVMWQELVAILPEHRILGLTPFHFAVVVSVVCMVPMIFVPSFKKLSWLNLVGCLSTVLVTVTMVSVVGVDPKRSRMPAQHPAGHDILRLGIFQATGIFVLSNSGHSSLPVLRNSMKKPQDFDAVLNLGFLTMMVLYGLVAACGYYYFGRGAHELVTADLKINSAVSGVSLLIKGLTVDKLVSFFILCNTFTTYPNLLLVIQDTVWSVLPYVHSLGVHPPYFIGLGARTLQFVVGCLISYGAYNYVGNFMSIAGGFCSISCSLLLPTIFFMILYRRNLSKAANLGLTCLLCLGLVLLVFITAQNVIDIVHRSSKASRESNSLAGIFLRHYGSASPLERVQWT